MAEMRRTKAEGGWAVVCTEEIEIHPSGDHSPCWRAIMDDTDIPVLAKMCDGIHEFGSSLAELVHVVKCHQTGIVDLFLSPSHIPVVSHEPLQARDGSTRYEKFKKMA